MARDNKAAQGNRCKAGRALEEDITRRLEDLLDDDPDLHVKKKPRYEDKAASVAGFFKRTKKDGTTVVYNLDPDIAVETTAGTPVVGFGLKTSLKDRRKEDYLCAIRFKKSHPTVPWIEITRSEQPTEYDEEIIRRFCERACKESFGEWDFCWSIRVPAHMKELA